MSFQTTNFDGAVVLKVGTYWPDGRTYYGFVGKVSILEAKQVVGFEVKDESNWIARIESADGSRSLNVPGCQVGRVLQGDFAHVGNNGFVEV